MSLSDFGIAPLAVNNYLWETMKTIQPSLSQTKNYGQKTPFFPLGDSASGNKSWEKAMAGRLKEKTGIDPFTIDQVAYSEKGERKFLSPYIMLANA
jgi:hypothetical protein